MTSYFSLKNQGDREGHQPLAPEYQESETAVLPHCSCRGLVHSGHVFLQNFPSKKGHLFPGPFSPWEKMLFWGFS